MRPAQPCKSSVFWLSFPPLLLPSPWTTLNNSYPSLVFTPFNFLWPMSQSLLARASGHAGRLISFIFPLKAVPSGWSIRFVALRWMPIGFSIICLISLSLWLLRKIPFVCLCCCKIRMMEVESLLTANRTDLFSHQASSCPQDTGIPSPLSFTLLLGCGATVLIGLWYVCRDRKRWSVFHPTSFPCGIFS